MLLQQCPACLVRLSRDELIRDVLLWTPTHGRAKAGRPARTYIQQLCEDTGCCPEGLPRAMNDREEWWERVRDIRATSAIWWWWWVILPKAPITIGIIVTFMFHWFFNSLARSRLLIFLYTFLQIYSVVRQDRKVYNFAYSLFLLIIMRSGLLAGIRWSVCMLKSHGSLKDSYYYNHYHYYCYLL